MNNIFWITTSVHEKLKEILQNHEELSPSESRELVTELRHSLYCLAGYCGTFENHDLIAQFIFEIFEFPFIVSHLDLMIKPDIFFRSNDVL